MKSNKKFVEWVNWRKPKICRRALRGSLASI